MPKRFFKYSRTEPARTILFVTALIGGLAQLSTLLFLFNTGEPVSLIVNAVVVIPICIWGVWSAHINNIRQMSNSSMALFILWLWSGLTRLAFSPDAMMLLWIPMIIVAMTMAVVHINMSGLRKLGDHE